MKSQLEKYIRENTKSPSEVEVESILKIFEEVTYSKGDVFKKNDSIGRNLGFIISGSARSYVRKKNGDEITGLITSENEFLTDMISIRTGENTPIVIEFLEQSSVLSTPISKMKALLEHNLTFNILLREYMADRAVELGKRHLLFLTGTSKERYKHIIENNPHLLKKFPLRFIATLIGITPTQLSRIRKELQK